MIEAKAKLRQLLPNTLAATLYLLYAFIIWRFCREAGFFYDEMDCNTYAAVNFFSHLRFSGRELSEAFDPAITSGVAVIWPAAVNWALGGNLFDQRMLLSLISASGISIFCFYALKRVELPKALLFLGTAIFSCVLFLVVPNLISYAQNLGEVPAYFFILSAILIFKKNAFAAGILAGLAVWTGKFIFFPAVIGMIPVYSWFFSSSLKAAARSMLCAFLGFIFVFLLWSIVIWIGTDFHYLLNWYKEFFQFVLFGGFSGLVGGPKLTLAQRLSSPDMEWAHYDLSFKSKILFLCFAPILVSIAAWLMSLKNKFFQTRESVVMICASAGVLVYNYWWFFHHPLMSLRHLEPSLLIAFTVVAYALLVVLRPVFHKNGVYTGISTVLLGLLIALKLIILITRMPAPPPSPTYAEGCIDIHTPECTLYMKRDDVKFRKTN